MTAYSEELALTMISISPDREKAIQMQNDAVVKSLQKELEALMISLSGYSPRKEIGADEIIIKVCAALALEPAAMLSKSRKRELTEARAIAMRIIKNDTSLSLKDIGLLFSGRDHSTVIYNLDTYADLSDTDILFQAKILKVKEVLNYEN